MALLRGWPGPRPAPTSLQRQALPPQQKQKLPPDWAPQRWVRCLHQGPAVHQSGGVASTVCDKCCAGPKTMLTGRFRLGAHQLNMVWGKSCDTS